MNMRRARIMNVGCTIYRQYRKQADVFVDDRYIGYLYKTSPRAIWLFHDNVKGRRTWYSDHNHINDAFNEFKDNPGNGWIVNQEPVNGTWTEGI